MSSGKIQQQFGANAAAYATSPIHAKGASLGRLVTLLGAQGDWQALDIATGAGHTALALAPQVASVVAVDITAEMVATAAAQAAAAGVENISFEVADAEALPFEDNQFDLVSCRIAAHHFSHVDRFMAESARVLKRGGLLAVVDNIVPGSRLKGKKARLAREAGNYINAFEKLRDPSHNRCLSLNEWESAFRRAGFRLMEEELLEKEMAFGPWTSRMQVPADNVIRLRAMLTQAPAEAARFLTPQRADDRISFRLTEVILIGKLESGD